MANESAVRQRIGAMLRENGFFVQAVESTTNPGMFDTYYRKDRYTVGWIEFKHIKEWPKRTTTSLFRSLNHPLLNEQAVFAYQEIRKGGRADIIVAHERDYYFVPGTLADTFNDLTPETIRQFKIPKNQIVDLLEEQLYYAREL